MMQNIHLGGNMKLIKLLQIQSVIEGRIIPSDMQEQCNQTYFSESKAEHIPIGNMDLIHFIRAFNKKERTYKNNYTNDLINMVKELESIVIK